MTNLDLSETSTLENGLAETSVHPWYDPNFTFDLVIVTMSFTVWAIFWIP